MIINTPVLVTIKANNKDYYKKLNYDFYEREDGSIPNGTKIYVNPNDLPDNSTIKVDVECDCCHKIYKREYKNYLQSIKINNKYICIHCHVKNNHEMMDYSKRRNRKRIYNIDDIIKKMKTRGLEIDLEKTDISLLKSDTQIFYYCKNHFDKGLLHKNLYRLLYDIDNNKFCCRWGIYDTRRGKHAANWKNNNSKYYIDRKSKEYADWREKIFKRDNYTCQCCGNNSGGNLTAHHILNFSSFEDLRFDVDNGITLCNECHNPSVIGSFHNIYGTYNNTKEQLQKYIVNKRNKLGLPEINIDKII